MRGLIFDPFAGISGDMLLGALIDLGLEPEWLRSFVGGLGLDGVSVHVGHADRRGIRCGRVRFEVPEQRSHRHLSDVLEIVEASEASEWVRQRAGAAFRAVAQAEAEIHGTTVERVHFHEVGALDSILDVLCGIAGVERLGYRTFHYRPVAVARGTVEIEHGSYPLPAPATLKILRGYRLRETGYAEECTTPTGAALLATLTQGSEAPWQAVVGRSGYGAGTRDPGNRPNCLRLIECEVEAEEARPLLMVQTDVDDMPAEYVPGAREELVHAGALDVVTLPVAMKKGRPGLRFEALVDEARLEPVLEALFRSTTTIGARYWAVRRPALERQETTVEWRGHRIRRKNVRLADGTVRGKVEYEDVARVAREEGLDPLAVRAELESARPGWAASDEHTTNDHREREDPE